MSKQGVKRFGQVFSFKRKVHHGPSFKKKKEKVKKSDIVDKEIDELQQKINAGIDASEIKSFDDFPLSKNTLSGLRKAKLTTPTEIQKQAIAQALQGQDVLGAAKTGSGKTLAFLIPILEVLHKAKMSSAFGMAAIVITPTRELAFQIFEVLNKIRSFHDFTANLIIGGKKMWREEHLMSNTNIVVCTVGRLLHHLDQTPSFNADDLKILVLDEADRIMDSKFAKDMDHIINHLPTQRQTLMFSATQTKSVKALARLSLKDPSYVSVHEHEQHATPSRLEQSYIVCELHEKLSMLYSFLKNHPNNKIIVFLQTCKQVRYVHAVMKRERPGMSVLGLYGGINQLRRIDVYRDFCRKQNAILFATDIACRGLDFPAVNWVVQLDCPVDVDTYIHRAGRTARFERNGQALLVLVPEEEEQMVDALQRRKIPIKKISVDTKRVQDITGSVSSACATCTETKDMAERAFRTYVYSLHVMKNSIVNRLNLEKFAKSLGLFLQPKLRFLKKKKAEVAEEEMDDLEDASDAAMLLKPKVGQPVKVEEEELEEEEEDREGGRTKKPVTQAALAKKLKKKNITINTRVVFDEEGAPVRDAYKRRYADEEEEEEEDGGINVTAAAKRLRMEDAAVDRRIERERIKQKHREERIKQKEKRRAAQQPRRTASDEEEEEEEGAVLEGGEEDDPFQYIPDPDLLAARKEEEEESSGDDDGMDSEDKSDAEDSQDDDSDGDDSDDDDDDDDDQNDNQDHGRSLEDAALQLLKRGRMKK